MTEAVKARDTTQKKDCHEAINQANEKVKIFSNPIPNHDTTENSNKKKNTIANFVDTNYPFKNMVTINDVKHVIAYIEPEYPISFHLRIHRVTYPSVSYNQVPHVENLPPLDAIDPSGNYSIVPMVSGYVPLSTSTIVPLCKSNL